VVTGVIDAEQAAIDHYRKIIRGAEGNDWVTQDLAIRLLADEEAHLRRFQGHLSELEQR
jgi:bacterioferritin